MVQGALIHHTRAHTQRAQTQIEQLAASIAQEPRCAAETNGMNDQTPNALSAATANQPATLRKPDPTAVRMNLDGMRIQAATAGKLSTGRVDGKSAPPLRA